MKKFLLKPLVLGFLLILSGEAHAQFDLGGLLKNVIPGSKSNTSTSSQSTEGKEGGIFSSLTSLFSGDKVASQSDLVGTWAYEEPAIVLTSDNMLKGLGGKVASATAEKKLSEKLERYGFKRGVLTMTFDNNGNFSQTFKKKTYKGTYAIDGKNVVLKYSGKISQVVGTTQISGNDLLIVMDLSKLLKYVGQLSTVVQDPKLQTAASLLGGMDGLECGLKLKKQ